MRDELSQKELDEIFYGPKPKLQATFYTEEVLDVSLSRKVGERVTKGADYIHLVCEKENSEFRRPATQQDKREFAAAWRQYEDAKERDDGLPEKVSDLRDTEDCAYLTRAS